MPRKAKIIWNGKPTSRLNTPEINQIIRSLRKRREESKELQDMIASLKMQRDSLKAKRNHAGIVAFAITQAIILSVTLIYYIKDWIQYS